MSFTPPYNLLKLYKVQEPSPNEIDTGVILGKSPARSMFLIGQKIDQEVQNDIEVSIFAWIPMIACT